MDSNTETGAARRIRSFIRRQGRITQAQQHAIAQLWSTYCLDPELTADFHQVFGRKAPLFIEIGFGNGESLAAMAAANPHLDYIGIEVHRPGVGYLMRLLEQKKLTNVRIFCYDAVEILQRNITDNSLSGIHLYFPDPWHKKRHHKRRIVNADFSRLIAAKLKPSGYFHAATDWENYALQMLEILRQNNQLHNTSADNQFVARPGYRPLTKFEKRGIKLGHGVWDLVFTKS